MELFYNFLIDVIFGIINAKNIKFRYLDAVVTIFFCVSCCFCFKPIYSVKPFPTNL